MNIKTKIFLSLVIGIITCFSSGATVFQAEDADLYNAEVENEHSGYSGIGYVNFDNETGSYLEFRIGMAVSGKQTIKIWYANGSSSSRPMSISLNDTVLVESVNFEPTGGWTTWDTLSVELNINAGIHVFRISSTGSDGGPNIDQFDISGEQLTSYELTLSTSGDGSILVSPENEPYFAGQEIMLIAKPGWSSVFSGWSGDYTSTEDTLTFVLDSDKTIQASFETIELEIPEPDFSMIGFATLSGDGLETTTGGDGGDVVIIETLAELVEWGESREDNSNPETVYIKGYLEAEETQVVTIKHGSNISIYGDSDSDGGYAELKNISLNIRDYNNVIVRNLKMHEVFYPNDDLTIDECHHVWIDHCEFHSIIGTGIGVDTYDGLLDIKKGSHNVTVSWCYFHDHMKTVLIGHSDNNGDQDQELQVTFHHNWFSNTDGRNPSLRFGEVHYFNNYLDNISDYGFAVRNSAHAKIENCHFENVNLPVASDKFEGHGYACISGCIYTGSCTEADNEVTEPLDCSYWDVYPEYSYELEDVNTVYLSVNKYAGVGQINLTTTGSELTYTNSFDIRNVFINDNQINISYTVSETTDVTLTVYSINGSKIISEEKTLVSGNGLVQLNTSLKRGIYIVAAQTKNSVISRKFVF